MSSPIQPPLRVTTVGGTPSGRPITTIKVSDGDLTISGNVATIDTSGSGGLPGGSNNEIQFNNSGAFDGDAGFLMSVKGDGGTTKIQVGNILVGANLGVGTAATNGTVYIQSDGSGQIFLTSGSDSGGTFADTIVNINCNAGSDNSILRFRDNSSTKEANIKLDGSSNLDIDNENTDKNIELSVKGTGSIEMKNATTNNASTLIVRGNGTGIPTINLTNDTKAVTIKCDESQKLKVAGGSSSFIFDASSGTGGITWPDGTTQTTAASGGDSYGALANPTSMNSTSLKINANQRVGGGTYGGTTAIEYFYGPVAYPFVSPHTGTIADLTIEVTSAAAGRSVNVGIYSADSTTGLPSSLVASANFSVATAAQVTQTSFTGTPSVTRGSLYWIAHFSDSATGGSGSAKARENNPGFNAPSNIVAGLISSAYFGNSLPNSVYFDGETSLPSSVTASDCIGINRDLLDVIIGW